MEKTTQNLINKYNKSVDNIKNQEIAIEKVKNKLNELNSGTKTPQSIKSLNTELKNAEKEIKNLEKEYQNTIDEISKKQFDLEWSQKNGNSQEELNIKTDLGNLDIKTIDLATQLENARERAENLKLTLETLKINPNNSAEVIELNSKLELMNSKLFQTKEEANQLKNEIGKALNEQSTLKFGNGISEISKKIDKFKNKMSRLIGTAMVFSLMRNYLTSLRNGFISLLKQNDVFSNSLNQIKANLMTAFAPIYNACLPAINSLMSALSKLTGTIAMFVSNLFGKSIQETTAEAKKLSKSLKKVSSSGEEASGSLASFDKLEVVQDNSVSSGGTSNSTGIDYSGEIQYSQRLLDFLNKIKEFVSENKELVIGCIAGITGALISLKLLGLDPIMGLGIGLIIAGIVTTIQGIINFIKDPSWENFSVILLGLTGILAGVAVAMLAVNAANPVAWIMLAIAAVIALVALIIKYWEPIKEWILKMASWFNEHVIQPIKDFFTSLWTFISDSATNAWNFIKGIFIGVGTWFNDYVIKPITNFFAGMWNGFVSGAKTSWNTVKNVFSSVTNFFKTIFGNAWSAVKKVFSTGGKIFDGIKEGILNGFKSIVNAIIKGINKVVAIPFNGINTALKKIKGISIAGIKPFDWISTISVPQLPYLAQGTVIPPRQEFAAILGDQKHGTNIEAPLETIKQANREVIEEFMGSLNGLNNKEKEIVLKNLTIIAQFGNKTFQKLVIDSLRLSEKEMGKPLLVN